MGRLYNSTEPGGGISTLSYASTMGDSFYERGFIATAAATGGGLYSCCDVVWANDLLGVSNSEILLRANYAVGGAPLRTIVSTQLPLMRADGFPIALINAGINSLDSSLGADNISIEAFLDYYQTIFDTLSPVKKVIFVHNLCPVGSATASLKKDRTSEIPLVNWQLANLAKNYHNVFIVDSYGAVVDGASNTLDPKSGMLLADLVHPSTLGAQARGYALADCIVKNRVQIFQPTKTQIALPAFSGTGGTVTKTSGAGSTVNSTPPVGWDLQIAAGLPTITITSQAPNRIRFQVVNTPGTNCVAYLRPTNNAALTAAIGPGKILGYRFSYSIISSNLATRVGGTVRFSGTALFHTGGAQQDYEAAPTFPTKPCAGARVGMPYLFAGSPSNLEFLISMAVAANPAGTLTVEIWNPQMYLYS
jgi:hypothetical protein